MASNTPSSWDCIMLLNQKAAKQQRVLEYNNKMKYVCVAVGLGSRWCSSRGLLFLQLEKNYECICFCARGKIKILPPSLIYLYLDNHYSLGGEKELMRAEQICKLSHMWPFWIIWEANLWSDSFSINWKQAERFLLSPSPPSPHFF